MNAQETLASLKNEIALKEALSAEYRALSEEGDNLQANDPRVDEICIRIDQIQAELGAVQEKIMKVTWKRQFGVDPTF